MFFFALRLLLLLLSLTCQNDRVQTSNTEEQPLHHIHPGSKHVCGSSMSLSSNSRLNEPRTFPAAFFWVVLFVLTPQLGYILHGFATDTDVLSVFFFVAKEVEAEKKKNIIQQPWARCVPSLSAVWAFNKIVFFTLWANSLHQNILYASLTHIPRI